MNPQEQVFSFIDSSVEQICSLQRLLTSIPALGPESGGEGEIKKAEALVQWLKEKGLTQINRFDAKDNRVPSGIRPNIVVTIAGAQKDKSLWIMSHLDVVPPGDLAAWQSDPYILRCEDGKMFGRGTEDNQQGLVSSVFAALALLSSGKKPSYNVKLLFVADEEMGSEFGINYLLSNYSLFTKNDIIIVPDSGNKEGNEIEIAEKKIWWGKVQIKGKQCHASTPDEGRNAFLAGCDLALQIHQLQKEFSATDPLFNPNYSTFSPTKKEANVPNVNTIPGNDVFYFDLRILPQYNLKDIEKAIKRCTREVEKKYGVLISLDTIQKNDSPAVKESSPAVKMLRQSIKEVYSIDAKAIGIGGGTVAAPLRKEGLDAVVWCKIDNMAHQPNEYCLVNNVIGDAKVFAHLMLSL